MVEMNIESIGTLERRSVVAELLVDRGKLLVVTGLGSPSYDVTAAGDMDTNFYLWGAMGSAATVGLGLALAQPEKPVTVITGDGEMYMGLGALSTIGAKQPKNLSIIVLDNGRFGETGMQKAHSSYGIDLAGVAQACQFNTVEKIEDMNGISQFRPLLQSTNSGLRFAQVMIKAENLVRTIPPRDNVHLKNRFRAALGFSMI